MGHKDEVLQILNDWERSEEYIDPMDMAQSYAMLEMRDNAIVWLEKSYRERSFLMVALKAQSIWDPYRDDPRFMEIYNKMNFPN